MKDVVCTSRRSSWTGLEPTMDYSIVFVRRGCFRRRVDGVESFLDPVSIYLERPGRPDLFVNARLITAGYARTLSIPPNTAHAAQLAVLERGAALAGRGLWSACG